MVIFYGLIGAGGHGRETMPILKEMVDASGAPGEHRLMFVVEGPRESGRINGYPVISLAEFLALEGERCFNIAIADARARERLAQVCIAEALKPFSIISRSAVVMDGNEIGEGAILSPLSAVTSNARVGRFFHANIYARVAHDCVIGDFVTFGPGAQCNGNVVVEDYAYIGTGAMIKEGTRAHPLIIGKGATVGMGAVVTKDVPASATVVGNPARPLVK